MFSMTKCLGCSGIKKFLIFKYVKFQQPINIPEMISFPFILKFDRFKVVNDLQFWNILFTNSKLLVLKFCKFNEVNE